MTLDSATFLKPIAHRGLHDSRLGIIENTDQAFEAAIAGGFGIECDLRGAADGAPFVFHDDTIERLIDGRGPFDALLPNAIGRLRFRATSSARIQTFAELLDSVAGRQPIFAEIKSEWRPPDETFLRHVASLAAQYRGPLALMSFDPAVMRLIRSLAPDVPRGIISGSFSGAGWWDRQVSRQRAALLRDLLESGPVEPCFYAYDVAALPTPVTRYVREVAGLPLLTWTVRTDRDRVAAAAWADAPIFEGTVPSFASQS